MYALVLKDALAQGKKVAPSCKFYIQFGSQETREYAVRKGYLDVFQKSGAIVIEPSCGACINAGPGQMYLASPLTVAASAVAGFITEYQPAERKELVGA